MKWAGLILLSITIALALYLVWFIGAIPVRVAAERGHPKADAIRVEPGQRLSSAWLVGPGSLCGLTHIPHPRCQLTQRNPPPI